MVARIRMCVLLLRWVGEGLGFGGGATTSLRQQSSAEGLQEKVRRAANGTATEAKASSTSDLKEQRMLAGYVHVHAEETAGRRRSAHFHLDGHKQLWYQLIREPVPTWAKLGQTGLTLMLAVRH